MNFFQRRKRLKMKARVRYLIARHNALLDMFELSQEIPADLYKEFFAVKTELEECELLRKERRYSNEP